MVGMWRRVADGEQAPTGAEHPQCHLPPRWVGVLRLIDEDPVVLLQGYILEQRYVQHVVEVHDGEPAIPELRVAVPLILESTFVTGLQHLDAE